MLINIGLQIIHTYTVSTAAQLDSLPGGAGDFFSGRNGNTITRERGRAGSRHRPRPWVMKISVTPISPRRNQKSTYVYATCQPKGYYAFNEYSDRTSPYPWSLCAAGTLHYVGGRESRQVPE